MRPAKEMSFNLCGTIKRDVECVLSISSPETKERRRDDTPYQCQSRMCKVRRAVSTRHFCLRIRRRWLQGDCELRVPRVPPPEQVRGRILDRSAARHHLPKFPSAFRRFSRCCRKYPMTSAVCAGCQQTVGQRPTQLQGDRSCAWRAHITCDLKRRSSILLAFISDEMPKEISTLAPTGPGC